MPKQMRLLYINICAFCGPIHDARQLWDDYSEAMSEDILRNGGEDMTVERAKNIALHDIGIQLVKLGMSLDDLGINLYNLKLKYCESNCG